jgi:hypothetical protein
MGDRGRGYGISESIKTFCFPQEHDGGDQDNKLLCADISWRLLDRGMLWGSVLNRDLKTSTIGEGNPGNKHGLEWWKLLSDCEMDGLTASIDYTRLEPFVYSHFFPVNRFTHWTSSLGSDLQPNSDRLRGSMSFRLLRNLIISSTVSYRRQGSIGSTIEQPISPGEHRMLFP